MNTNLLNSLLSDEKLTTEDLDKIKDALKVGKHIFVMGKAKTGISTMLCNILDMTPLDARIVVVSKDLPRLTPIMGELDLDKTKNRTLNMVCAVETIEESLRTKSKIVTIDRLDDFCDTDKSAKRGVLDLFMDKDNSIITSVQLPANAIVNKDTLRLNLKSAMYKFKLDEAIYNKSDVLVIQLDRVDGEFSIEVEEINYKFTQDLVVSVPSDTGVVGVNTITMKSELGCPMCEVLESKKQDDSDVTHFEHHGKDVPQSVIDSILDPDADYHEYKQNQGINTSINSKSGGSTEDVISRFNVKYNVQDAIDPTGHMHVTSEIDDEHYAGLKKQMETGYINKKGNMKIVLATGNVNKVSEFKELMKEPLVFNGVELEVVTMKDMGIIEDIPENGKSYEVNALIKATYVFNKLGGKHIVISEDSGFSVVGLGMKPGVESARFMSDVTSDERNQHIVNQLIGRPDSERSCYYLANMVALLPFFHKSTLTSDGVVFGKVAEELRGTNGFAYDSIFIPALYVDKNKTVAELTSDEKNCISHRGQALSSLFAKLREALNYNSTEK